MLDRERRSQEENENGLRSIFLATLQLEKYIHSTADEVQHDREGKCKNVFLSNFWELSWGRLPFYVC